MVPLKPPDFNFDITNNFTWNIEIIVEPIKEDLKESSYPNGAQPKGTIMFKVANQFSTEWRKSISHTMDESNNKSSKWQEINDDTIKITIYKSQALISFYLV